MATLIIPRTTILVNEWLLKDLANIVLKYFCSEFRCWEISNDADDWNYGLHEACLGGHMEIAQLIISKGANYWESGLHAACCGGYMELVNLMISCGANDWNYGLSGACLGGHMEIAQLMISEGADCWDEGLDHACRGGHMELARLIMKTFGVVEYRCGKSISDHK